MPTPEWLDAGLGVLLGLLVGSFLNVVILRLPAIMYRDWLREAADNLLPADPTQGVETSLWDLVFKGKRPPPAHLHASAQEAAKDLETLEPLGIARPRSRCGHCGRAIRWYENVPVLSYVVLRGRCAGCRSRIGWRYPAVEVVTAAFFGLCAWRWGLTPLAGVWAVFAALLICQFMIDLDTQLLPDTLNYMLLWLGLVVAAMGWTVPLTAAVWGAAAGYLILWSFYHLYRLATGKEGMGFGDFKLMAALGAWLGADYLLAILLMASVVGAILGSIMLLVGRLANKDIPIAFGPYLAGAGLLCLMVGPQELRALVPFAFPLTVR